MKLSQKDGKSGRQKDYSLYIKHFSDLLTCGLADQFKRYHQEIIFPFAFVDPVSEVSMKRHLP
jgi:hypothetical protein